VVERIRVADPSGPPSMVVRFDCRVGGVRADDGRRGSSVQADRDPVPGDRQAVDAVAGKR
jgi:hypothetical protein